MANDLRYAIRNLLRSPGFTLVAVVVLALGIGANTAIFSLLMTVLTQSATGIRAPERLAVLSRGEGGFGFDRFSYPDYCDYRDLNKVFSGLMAYSNTAFSLSEGDEPEQLQGAVVSSNYFAVLGVPVHFGPEPERTAVVSHRLWKRRFSADPSLTGKAIRLNGRLYTVAAIAPETFHGTELDELLDVWVPIATDSDRARPDPWSNPLERRDTFLVVVGRLNPGVALAQARAEVTLIGRQLRAAYPQAHPSEERADVTLDRHVALDPFTSGMAAGFLLVLMAAVAFVLLIAVANVANLLLVRAFARRKQTAVRLALGASRARLVRQLLTESLVLSLAGGAAGLLFAFVIVRLMMMMVKDLRFVEAHLDASMLGFTMLVSILTGLLFGLAPTLQSYKPDLAPAITEGAGTGSPGRSHLRGLLVIFEVCLSLVLLIGAGLLLRSFRNVRSMPTGFASDNVLLMSIDPGRLGYDRAKREALYRDLCDRLNQQPGVVSGSLALKIAVGGYGFKGRYVLDGPAPSMENSFEVHDNVIAPLYFETLKIPLVQGRDFTARDARGAPGVVIVNEALAQWQWPNQNPLGKRMRQYGMGLGPPLEVVGVARNVRQDPVEAPKPYLWLPLFQHAQDQVVLHARAKVNTGALAPLITREIHILDKDLPVFKVMTFDQCINDELSPLWSLASLVSAFGILALVLATVGLYGVTSYTVTQRTREIGVRMALGASRATVCRLIIGQSMTLVLTGVLTGVLGALALTRILESILFGITAANPATYAVVSLLLLLISWVAAYIPARRAASVDPIAALRQE